MSPGKVLSPAAQFKVKPFWVMLVCIVPCLSVVEPPPIATALSRFAIAPVPIAILLVLAASALVPNAKAISPAMALVPKATEDSPVVVFRYCSVRPSLFVLILNALPVMALKACSIVSCVSVPLVGSVYLVCVFALLSTSSPPIATEELPLA